MDIFKKIDFCKVGAVYIREVFMKLYHYAPKENTVFKNGLLSVSKLDESDLLKKYTHVHRANSQNRDDIMAWLENTFKGRSRSVSCLTEPIQWQGNDIVLTKIVNHSILLSFNLEELIKDGLVESVWCKNGSDPEGCNERLYQVKPEEIDFSPLPWENVDASKELLYAVIRHYLIVLKEGYIPSQYITLEKDNPNKSIYKQFKSSIRKIFSKK